MANNEIINYIKSELAKGESKETIVNSLSQAGWQNKDVQEAFNSLSAPVSPIATSPQHTAEIVNEKNYPITKLWIFKAPIIIIVISIVALLFGYYFPYLVIALPIYLIANPLIRANFHYSTDEKYFIVRQGVFSKKQRNLPYGVIQNVLVKQDWFDRVFGLASFSVENASQGGGKGFFGRSKSFRMGGAYQQQGETVGSSGNKVNIPGLRKKDAEALKLILLQRMKENPIEESGL